jgi:hypothetical protein
VSDLPTCTLCGRIDPIAGGAMEVRITAAPTTSLTLRAGSLTLTHASPTPMRARWDVVVLPGM